jgi:hypothetical protein
MLESGGQVCLHACKEDFMHDLCLNTPQPTGNPIAIPMEDDLAHTAEHPFCFSDDQCPCHQDFLLIAEGAQAVTDGLLTPGEATSFVAGRLL